MNEEKIKKLKNSIIKKLVGPVYREDKTNLLDYLKSFGLTPEERVVVLMLLEDK